MHFAPDFAALIAFAAPDGLRAEGVPPVVEVVTFRLVDGAKTDEFVKAAAAMDPYLHSTGAMISRTLSADADGLWTDYITWSSMEAALNAAGAIMNEPVAGPFMSMIDTDSVTMRHAYIQYSVQME